MTAAGASSSRDAPAATSNAWTHRSNGASWAPSKACWAIRPPATDESPGRDDEWRLRVGDWRVRFTRNSDTRTVLILRVLPRGRAYRD